MSSDAATTTPRIALVAIIALVIAGLVAVDRFLASAQDAEVQRLAQTSWSEGIRLRDAGKANEAVEALRKAHALERQNTGYELDLIEALMTAGKPDKAQSLMSDALERDPNGGRTNLLAARLMIAQGRKSDAESYYHRAIYGEWPTDADAHRVAVRMELVDFLAARGKREGLLAELLPLQEEAGKDPETERHLARLFLLAGSPSRAADEYRALMKRDPKDGSAYVGLGDAELQLGEYHVAHDAFLAASARNPDDRSIREKMEVSSTLTALDPTSRRLASIEKYRRSQRVLELSQSDLQQCIAQHPALDSAETRELLSSASSMLEGKPPRVVTNEISEEVLGLAAKMWQARLRVCTVARSPEEESMRLIMEKLAQ